MTETTRELLEQLYFQGYFQGSEKTHQDWIVKSTELQRQSMTKRIYFPICWLLGHKIDPCMRFCKRCKIGEESLIRIKKLEKD